MNKTLKHIAVILILSTLLGFIRFYFLNDDEFTIIKKVRILNEAKVETNKLGIKKYPIPDVMTEPMIANLDFIKYYFDSNLATIIDARDVDEFNTKHIEGAINIPYDYYDDYADEISSLKYNDIYIIYVICISRCLMCVCACVCVCVCSIFVLCVCAYTDIYRIHMCFVLGANTPI